MDRTVYRLSVIDSVAPDVQTVSSTAAPMGWVLCSRVLESDDDLLRLTVGDSASVDATRERYASTRR